MNSEYWKKALEFEDIIFEKSEEGIAKITINRPEVRNAFRPLTVREMQRLWKMHVRTRELESSFLPVLEKSILFRRRSTDPR